MKRSTARWTTALAVTALFALPASGLAQQTAPATPGQPTEQSTAKSSPQDPAPTPAPQEPKPADSQAPAPQAGAPSAEPAQPPATPPDAAPPQPAAAQVDAATVKRHLTAARESLSALTQLPAAAQLTGDARTQVSQLITNFNELITTNTNWRAAYDKVEANLNALIGEGTDASAAAAAGTPGAVGTSGPVTIDPTIRAKLVEFRTHLAEFEKAASGGSAPARSSLEPAANASPSPAATTGSPASTPAPAATTGAPPEPQPPAAPATAPADSKQAGHSEALRHIEAIETILSGQSGAAASQAGAAASPTLDRAQIEQIRTHLTELRRALSQGDR